MFSFYLFIYFFTSFLINTPKVQNILSLPYFIVISYLRVLKNATGKHNEDMKRRVCIMQSRGEFSADNHVKLSNVLHSISIKLNSAS